MSVTTAAGEIEDPEPGGADNNALDATFAAARWVG
jgi:hypothetical protein